MTDPYRHPDTGGTPRWVKIFGIVALVVALLVVVMLLVGGGGHRPRRHGSAGGETPPFVVTAPAGVGGHPLAGTGAAPTRFAAKP